MPRHQSPRGSEDDLPTIPHEHRRDGPSEDVALLAATALGFAYAPTGNDQMHARRLATLADPHPESLARAQAAVLALAIGSAQIRRRAAALLRSAAGSVAVPNGAEPSLEMGAIGAPLAPSAEDRR
jgi:hypothetical protein